MFEVNLGILHAFVTISNIESYLTLPSFRNQFEEPFLVSKYKNRDEEARQRVFSKQFKIEIFRIKFQPVHFVVAIKIFCADLGSI